MTLLMFFSAQNNMVYEWRLKKKKKKINEFIIKS